MYIYFEIFMRDFKMRSDILTKFMYLRNYY